jgi:hypothetical protein
MLHLPSSQSSLQNQQDKGGPIVTNGVLFPKEGVLLYGITDLLIDVDRGLYKPIGIHEVSIFESQKNVVFLHFSGLAFFVCKKVLILL